MTDKIKKKFLAFVKKPIKKKHTYIIIALLISFLLIAPEDITWARDRVNYLILYAEGSGNVLEWRIEEGFLAVLLNEPLFLLMNIFLANFLYPEGIVKVIIFLGAFISLVSFGKLAQYNLWMLFFFLFFPNIILKYTAQIRQGLAIGVYAFGLSRLIDKKQWGFLRFTSVFIHTSLVFNILLEFLEKLFEKFKFELKARITLNLLFFVFIPIFFSIVLNLMNDRRLTENAFSRYADASGLGFILWFGIGSIYFAYSKRNFISNICIYGIVMYLAFYLTLDFGSRLFENIIPIFVATVLSDERRGFKTFFIILFCSIGTLMWITGAWHNIAARR